MNRLSFRLLVALGVLVLALQASLPWVGAAAAGRLGGDPLLLTALAVFLIGAVTLLVAFVAGARSLTHHERLHAAVEQAREDYVRLFHASPEGIFSADASFAFTAMNLSGARALGADEPSALMGARLPSLCADPEEARALLRALADGAATQVAVMRIRRRDGEPRWIELTCQAQPSPRGGLQGVDGVFRDVTDRVGAEEKARERFDKMQSAYLALGRANRHLALLADVARWQGETALRDEEIVEGVLRAAASVARADAGAAYLLERSGRVRVLRTLGGMELPKRRDVALPASYARIVAGEGACEELPFRSSIGATLSGSRKQAPSSCLVAAVQSRGETLGLVELYRTGPTYDLEDGPLIRSLAAQCAPSLARIRAAGN